MKQQTKPEKQYLYVPAAHVAAYIFRLLQPHCERIHLAGSIRRMKMLVKDIEIVCIPKREPIPSTPTLFDIEDCSLSPSGGGSASTKNDSTKRGGANTQVSKDFIEALMTITKQTIKGNADGKYMQIETTSTTCPGIMLDLFMPDADDYYRQYAIRTGSKDYAHHVIAAAWSRKGWTGINGVLYKKSECDCKETNGKKIYNLKSTTSNPTRPPVWNSEGEFFTWLGLPYIDPEQREIKGIPNTHQLNQSKHITSAIHGYQCYSPSS
jgi:DNA polymerase/3'-5' exonuclease PolX